MGSRTPAWQLWFASSRTWAQQLWLPGSRTLAQQLWFAGSGTPAQQLELAGSRTLAQQLWFSGFRIPTQQLWLADSWACGLSSCGSPALEHWLGSCGLPALEHRLSSFGTQAQLLHSMWDLPRPGIEPASLALSADSLPLSHQGSPQPSLSIASYFPIVKELPSLRKNI